MEWKIDRISRVLGRRCYMHVVMIGSNSRKVHINQLQSYHTGIQEKEDKATDVTTAAPPVQTKCRV